MLKATLDNGLRIIVEENHAAPVVAAQVWVRVGSADEEEGEFGLAHVHEHMLFKGTERRAVGEIASDVEAAGGDINAWTSFDQTVYHVTIASRELPVALDILSDAVQHSVFDAEELERELEVVLEELRRGKDTPSRVASELLFDNAFAKHPYRRPVIGFEESVKSFTREGILEFYRKWYQPQNMCLVVTGDVNPQEVVDHATKMFDASLNTGKVKRPPRAQEQSQDGLRFAIKGSDIQETHLSLAWPGTDLASADTPVLDVLSIMLGAGESSRLVRRVRRNMELVNDCYASNYTPQDAGLFVVGGQIHGEEIEAAYRALFTEALRMRYELADAAELEKAKTIILSDAVYQKETVQGVARKLGYFELVAGDTEFEDRYYEAVRNVTLEQVKAAAQKYLHPKNLTVTALVPEAFESALTKASIQGVNETAIAALEGEYAPQRYEPGALGVVKVQLENGATLLVREDDSVALVSVRAAAKGGLLAETAETSGISYLAGEVAVRGSEKYSAEQIIDECDAMAGGITGVSGRNSLGMRGDFLAETWDRGFELFASSLLEPTFAEAEIAKEKKTQLEDIEARKDNLAALAFEKFSKLMYGSHPYGMTTIGNKESVSALDRDAVLKAYRQQLRPDALTIAVVGAVDPKKTIEMVQRRIGKAMPHPEAGKFILPAAPEVLTAPREGHIEKDREQAHLVLGFLGVTLMDPRRYVLDVLSSVLGGQSGRLFLELRDKQSLAYSVSGFSMEGLERGYFAVYMGTSPDKLETAEAGIRSELQKILDTPVDAKELERAQRYLIGSHAIGLQRAGARCSTMALNEAYNIGYDAHAKYTAEIEAVTCDAIQAVARDIIRFDSMVKSVVSSGEK